MKALKPQTSSDQVLPAADLHLKIEILHCKITFIKKLLNQLVETGCCKTIKVDAISLLEMCIGASPDDSQAVQQAKGST